MANIISGGLKPERPKRRWKMRVHQSNGHPDKVHQAACDAGESGINRAVERDARKIDLHGPEYYYGNPDRIASAIGRAVSGVSVGMSGISDDRWAAAFGRKE